MAQPASSKKELGLKTTPPCVKDSQHVNRGGVFLFVDTFTTNCFTISMFHKIPRLDLYTSNHGWLQSRFLFSFADYYDPNNLEWGSLRVFNDDTIAPYSGFPMHSHKEMEIITIMLTGTLSHKDSMGNERSISGGDVQYMSAGTGVTHSEMNDGDSPVSLFQIWLYSNEANLKPKYVEENFNHTEDKGLHLLVSQNGENGSIRANTNASLFYANLIKGGTHTRHIKESDHILIYVRTGIIVCGGNHLEKGDQLRIHDEKLLTISVIQDAQFMMVLS